jgi:hypothetical protein
MPGGFEIDRTTGSALNATSCEIANQIRRSLALGNSLLSTNNLADAGSTRGKPPFSVGKARSYSAVRLGSRPANTSHQGNRTRPHFEQIGRGYGVGGGAYPLANNYSTIIPRKRNFAANLHESSSQAARYGTLNCENGQRSGNFQTVDRANETGITKSYVQAGRANLFQTNNYMSDMERNLSPDYDMTTIAGGGEPVND